MIRVLLVEDDDTIAQGLRYALEQEGYCLTAAATAAEGLRALREQPPFGLLLLDLGLPDGSALAVKIADGSDRARMPITAKLLAEHLASFANTPEFKSVAVAVNVDPQ